MMRYIHGHSAIFNHAQVYSGTFSNIQPCSRMLKDVEALSMHTKPYSGIFRHLQNPVKHVR